MKNTQQVVDSNFDRLQARNGLVAKNQSQMNKLLPMLELAAKKEQDPELVQQKYERRHKGLKKIEAALTKTVTSLVDLRKVDQATKLKKLTLGLRRIQKIVEDRPPVGTQKMLRAVTNELTSIREGVYTEAKMTRDDYEPHTLRAAVTQVQEMVAANAKAKKKFMDERSGVDDQEAEELRMYSEFESILKSTQEEARASNIETIRDQPFVVIRAPVIPMTKAVLDVARLKRAGFAAESMAGYPMFRNQLVVGINRSMLDLTDKEKAKATAIPRERVFKAAARVKRILERKTGARLHFVDERPHGAQGGSWFWLMTEQEVDAFAACWPGKRIQILNFGFAF